MRINNHNNLFHTIPNLTQFAMSILTDIQEGEPIEILHRRFTVLVHNIQELSDLANDIQYMPDYARQVVDNLSRLSHAANISLSQFPNDFDSNPYGSAIITIVKITTSIVNLSDLVSKLTEFEVTQASRAFRYTSVAVNG